VAPENFIHPMPLTWRREPFDHPDWIFEIKHDGFRAIAYVEKRNGERARSDHEPALNRALRSSNLLNRPVFDSRRRDGNP
jgi:hypothetical protein